MLTEDFSVYTDPDGFGDTATGASSDIDGIFERLYAEVNGIEGYYPTFLVDDDDADLVTKNSTNLTINSTVYQAISKRSDGTGMTLLVLEEQ